MHQVEIIVHVDESLDDERRDSIVSNLQAREGVASATFTPGRTHLMLIDYDSDKLNSSDILGYVREQHVGAELVGP
jgi:hypothetical protein